MQRSSNQWGKHLEVHYFAKWVEGKKYESYKLRPVKFYLEREHEEIVVKGINVIRWNMIKSLLGHGGTVASNRQNEALASVILLSFLLFLLHEVIKNILNS